MFGKILIGSEVTEIRNWNIDRGADAIDATSMSSGGKKEFKVGLTSWNGSFETINYVNLHGSVAIGSFYTGTAASTTTPVFAGTVIITNAGVATPHDNMVAYAHTFQGSGVCTPTTS
jgi:predicted secreted protein